MNKETYEALKNVIEKVKKLLGDKYNNRKRFSQDEVWEKATTTRDILKLESWIDEVAKEYQNK